MGKLLIVTEKPSVARNIADALNVRGDGKQGYIEDDQYVISWCVGHLVELAQPGAYGDQYVKWTYDSLPIIPVQWKYVVKDSTKKQFEILKKLMHRSDIVAVCEATDPGREGEAIYRFVHEQAGCTIQVKRLWVSSMEASAIQEGMLNLRPASEFDSLFEAARCRQHADWLVGINGTRLFTVLYGGKTLKVGRVQSPTLAMLVEREEQIQNFKKEPYYMVHLTSSKVEGLDAVSEHLKERKTAEEMSKACANGTARVVFLKKGQKSKKPPALYDLTSLQRDANRLLGYTAKQTLEYAQALYEKKLLTYPRTDSNYLSDDMAGTAEKVVEAIYHAMPYEQNPFIKPDIQTVLNSKKVSDHHALIPTVEVIRTGLDGIPESEAKLLALVAARLLEATAGKMVYEAVHAELECSGYSFSLSGKTIIDPGWKVFEEQFLKHFVPQKKKEDDGSGDEDGENCSIPQINEGMEICPTESRVTDHFTAPPKRYSEASLLAAMERAGADEMTEEAERKGLGTPATRADIIEKLVGDGYVKREKKLLIPTEDGINLISILPMIVKSPKMTAEWENDLTAIAKGELESLQFMGRIEELVEGLVSLYDSVSDEERSRFKKDNGAMGSCPHCGNQVLKGRYGAYCGGKCGMTFGKYKGKDLSDQQIEKLLAGDKVLMKGLTSKQGKEYSAYLIPEGIEEYTYTTREREVSGFRWKFRLEFPNPDRKKNSRSRKEAL